MINESDIQRLFGDSLETFINQIKIRASSLNNLNPHSKQYLLLDALFSNSPSGIIFVDSSGYEATQFSKNYLALKVAEQVLGDQFNRPFLVQFLNKWYKSRGLFGESGNEYCQRNLIRNNAETLYAFLYFVSDKSNDLFQEVISTSGIRLDHLVDALIGNPYECSQERRPELSAILSMHNLQNVARMEMIVKAVLSSLTETLKDEDPMPYGYDKLTIGKYKVQQIEKLLLSIDHHPEITRLGFYHMLIKEANQIPAVAIEIEKIIPQLSPEIQKNFAIVKLEQYISDRHQFNQLYKGRSVLKLFGFDQRAYTTETKIETAQALIDSLKNNTMPKLDAHHIAALKDGKLGSIHAQYQHLFEPSLSSIAGPSSSS